MLHRYQTNGDPGQECSTINYGIDHRSDTDCDGVPDIPVDKCPWVTEWDNSADSDGDCTDPSNCRGDECECGDQTLDGFVDIRDIIGVNSAIFAPQEMVSLCDANNDLHCDVGDIPAANQSIFIPNRSTCRAVTPPTCGDGQIDANLGEQCDDGPGKGPCNTACQALE